MNDESLVVQDNEVSSPEALEIMVRESAGVPINNLVMTKIIEISNEIPENVNQINSSFADYLAGRFLVGINLCGELASFASGHTLKMMSLKRKEYSTAYHVRAPQNGCKTVKDKEQYPYMDSEYIAADNKYIDAVIFEKMVEEKRDLLKKAHYHMRKLADKDPEAGFQDSKIVTNPNNSSNVYIAGKNNSQENSLVDDVDWDSMFE